MSDQHALPPDMPPDEDNAVLEGVEGRPDLVASPDPEAFRDDVEQEDPEGGS